MLNMWMNCDYNNSRCCIRCTLISQSTHNALAFRFVCFFHCAYGYIFLFVAGLISSLSMDEFLATMIKNGFFSFSFAVFVVLFSFIHVAKWRLFIYYSLLLLLFFRWFHANENNQCWRIVCAWYSTLRRQIVWIGGAWIVQFLLVFFACFLFIFLLFVSCFKKEILFLSTLEYGVKYRMWRMKDDVAVAFQYTLKRMNNEVNVIDRQLVSVLNGQTSILCIKICVDRTNKRRIFKFPSFRIFYDQIFAFLIRKHYK